MKYLAVHFLHVKDPDTYILLVKVVSIGAFLTFYVVFVPLEYVLTIRKRPHFFGSSSILRHQYFCTFQTGRG